MKQAATEFSLKTDGKGLYEFTAQVAAWVRAQAMTTGLLTLFSRHTSASLVIQENADPDVRADLERHFERMVPEGGRLYAHSVEGPDDMPAHIRSALTGNQLSVPLVRGGLALGTWQGIYLFEHRAAPHRRNIVAHLIGE